MSPSRTPASETPKTQTILKRKIQVYLKHEEMLEEWKALAKQREVSLSKFIVYHVNKSIKEQAAEDLLPRRELMRQLEEKDGIIEKLEVDNQLYRTLTKRFNEELHEKRAGPMVRPTRMYDKEVIELFRRRGFVRFDEIHNILKIPLDDSDTRKGIDKQLKYMVQVGLLKKESNGWRME